MAVSGSTIFFGGSQDQSSSTGLIDFLEDHTYIIWVANRLTTGGCAVSSISGAGATWSFLGTSDQSGTAQTVLEAWIGTVPADISSPIAVVLDADPARVAYAIEDLTGAVAEPDTVVQAVPYEPGAVTSATVTTMAPFTSPTNNAVYAGFMHRANENSTPEGTYDTVTNSAYATGGLGGNPISLLTEIHNGEDTSPSASWATSSPTAVLVLEIAAPAVVTLATLSRKGQVHTPSINNQALDIILDAAFDPVAFDDVAFQALGGVVSRKGVVHAPIMGSLVETPGFGAEGFDPLAFDSQAFQAGNSGLNRKGRVHAPVIESSGAVPTTVVSLGGGAVWDSPTATWDSVSILWDQGETGGTVSRKGQVHAPSSIEYGAPPPFQTFHIGIISRKGHVFAPEVFQIGSDTRTGTGLKAKFEQSIPLKVKFEEQSINLKARFE